MKIKNWNKFQHFKDRKPPWVKLYRDVLDDIEWYELDPLASKVLVMCWLIASEDDGKLPLAKTLAFRLRMTEKQTIDCLNKLSHWLEQDDINKISSQYQTDSLETETETETKIKESKDSLSAGLPTCPQNAILELWKKHLPNLPQPRVWDGSRQQALRARWAQAGKPSTFSPKGYSTQEDGLAWWDSFFAYIANDTKLAQGFETKDRVWRPDLVWVVNATNFAKIIDGKYQK
jgi:hypothetical protein